MDGLGGGWVVASQFSLRSSLPCLNEVLGFLIATPFILRLRSIMFEIEMNSSLVSILLGALLLFKPGLAIGDFD